MGQKLLSPEIITLVKEDNPDITEEQIEAVSAMFATSAVTLHHVTGDVPMPFAVMFTAQVFATSLLSLYLKHDLINVENVTEFYGKMRSGELDMETELAPKAERETKRRRGPLGFKFRRDE